MADVERSLLTKAIQTGAIEELMASKILPDHFHDVECRQLYDWCVKHVLRWGESPSFEDAKASPFGVKFSFEPSQSKVEYLVHKFVGQVKRREGLKGLADIARMLDDPSTDLSNIDEMFFEAAMRVTNSVPGSKYVRYSDAKQRKMQYERKEDGSWAGIPMGIPAFDQLTLGVQRHEFVSVAGWQGTGKSTLMAYACWVAYILGYTPMIFSLEMGGDELMRKFDLMGLNWQQNRADMVRHLNLKGHELTQEELERWEGVSERAANAKNDIIIVDDAGRPTVEWIHAEAAKAKPDMICIDYISLMQPPRQTDSMWQDLTRLTRQLKLLTKTMKVPVWGLAQTNAAGAKEGAELHTIAYSRSIGQDSDIVLGLFSNDEMREERRMEVRMLKNRDGQPMNAQMYWRPDLMYFEPWSSEHFFEKKFEVQDV